MADTSPAKRSVTITPHATDTQPVGRGLFVGVGGNVTGRLVEDGVDTVWKNIPSGTILPVQFLYIRATGTTATDMLAVL